MTTQYWITGTSGDWSTAADWVSGVVPSSTDDAVISSTSNGMTVNGTAVANLLTLDAAILTLGGTLTLGTSLTVDDGAQFKLIGGTLSAQSISSNNNGSLSGYGTVSGAVSGQVDITATGGILKVQGSLAADQGHLYIGSGATLELSNSAPVGAPIYFQGSPATLKLDAPTAFVGTIEAVVVGDTIDLAGIAANSAIYSGTTLTVNETNGQQLIYNNVIGNVAGDTVAVASDNNGGTLVYWGTPVPVITSEVLSKSGAVTLTGTTGEANDTIAVYDGTTLLGTTATASNGIWNLTTGNVSNAVHAYTATATDVAGNVGHSSNEAILGSTNADTLVGTSGNEIIIGNGGNDTITGGSGADTLTGGSGKVTFAFNSSSDSTPSSHDTITDFNASRDTIDFTNIAGINAHKGIATFEGKLTGSGNLSLNAHSVMSRCLLNIAKRSLLRLMLSCVGLASKHAAG